MSHRRSTSPGGIIHGQAIRGAHRLHPRSLPVQREADGARRHLLQIPAQLVPVAAECIRDLMSGRYDRQVAAETDLVSAGVVAAQLHNREARPRLTRRSSVLPVLLRTGGTDGSHRGSLHRRARGCDQSLIIIARAVHARADRVREHQFTRVGLQRLVCKGARSG